MTEVLTFTLSPENLPFWMPAGLARDIRADHGARLSEAQWNSIELQTLRSQRKDREKKGGRK